MHCYVKMKTTVMRILVMFLTVLVTMMMVMMMQVILMVVMMMTSSPWSESVKAPTSSIGRGKMIVEFFSAEIEFKV